MSKLRPRPIKWGCDIGAQIVITGNTCKRCKIDGVPISCPYGTSITKEEHDDTSSEMQHL